MFCLAFGLWPQQYRLRPFNFGSWRKPTPDPCHWVPIKPTLTTWQAQRAERPALPIFASRIVTAFLTMLPKSNLHRTIQYKHLPVGPTLDAYVHIHIHICNRHACVCIFLCICLSGTTYIDMLYMSGGCPRLAAYEAPNCHFELSVLTQPPETACAFRRAELQCSRHTCTNPTPSTSKDPDPPCGGKQEMRSAADETTSTHIPLVHQSEYRVFRSAHWDSWPRTPAPRSVGGQKTNTLPPTNMEVQKGTFQKESSLSTGVCALPC